MNDDIKLLLNSVVTKLNGKLEFTSTLDSMGNMSDKITIIYNVRNKNDEQPIRESD